MGRAKATKLVRVFCLQRILYLVVVVVLVNPIEGTANDTESFGGTCNVKQSCSRIQHLACISGVCQCESPSNQRFDNSSRKCLSVVGGGCTSNSSPDNGITQDKKHCIKNAICIDVTDESGLTYSECQCIEGFIENSSGECTPGIGKPCSYQPNECNPMGMVVCKNSICQCLDELQIYDQEMKRCVSPAGTHCKFDNFQLGCVKNAICYPFFYWNPPKCLCKPGYMQTKSRQCVAEAEYKRINTGINQIHQTTATTWSVNHTVQI